MCSKKLNPAFNYFFTLTFICQQWFANATVEVLRPRGVPLTKKVFYVPEQDFSCIDGSSIIPFSFVNDDYCDCEDGSDEPGTSACSNAFFHCVNTGFNSVNIPSSRVNDNICDCCDGSDEYNGSTNCMNTCLELGKQAKEEEQKLIELYATGYDLREKYSEQGKKLKEEYKAKLENLKGVEIEEEKIKGEKEGIKNKAEEEEKAALDVYKALKEEQTKKKEELEILKHQEEETKNAEAAFKELNLNGDKYLTFDELQQFPKFDSNGDGQVSEEEAKFFLHMKESMDIEEFVTTGWMIMKPIYQSDKKLEAEEPISPEKDTEEEGEEEDYDDPSSLGDKLNQDDDEDFDSTETELANDDVGSDNDTEVQSQPEDEYDEETRRLVEIANEARKQHKEIADKLQKTQDEIKILQSFIDEDFGHSEEFAILKGQCFDYSDREYIYRFCPFDKASQIIQNSGSDTVVNLGRWGSWVGPENNKYSKMKYENGQTCWNGPARSVMVLLQCGVENKLLSSSEPNRCEYLFEFSTPALCFLQKIPHLIHQHTEL